MGKYDLITRMITQVDKLVDLRGAEKCRAALELISMLMALEEGLRRDDKTNQDQLDALRTQLAQLTGEDDTEECGGRRYEIGKTAAGGEG